MHKKKMKKVFIFMEALNLVMSYNVGTYVLKRKTSLRQLYKVPYLLDVLTGGFCIPFFWRLLTTL